MAGHNLMEEKFEEIKVFGSPALLSGQRFDHGSVPEGLYIYEVRHSGNSWDEPVQVSVCVVNNFMGTLVTRTPLALHEDGCLGTVSADWDFEYGANLTAGEFMDRYPPEPYSHKVKENYIGITKPETLMVWASLARPGLEISEEQAGLVLNFMEHQGYTLSVSGRQTAGQTWEITSCFLAGCLHRRYMEKNVINLQWALCQTGKVPGRKTM